MKNKITILILLYIVTSTIFSNAQTNVSGGIYTNTTWTKVNSPYIVTGNIVLFPGKILTIEPGVEVKIDGFYTIEIRGTLFAIGTIADSISFISNGSLIANTWGGINICNVTQNSVGLFEYCKIKHSTFGITFEISSGNNSSYIKNSLFENNYNASGYDGWNFPIDNCVFANNFNAINGHYGVLVTNSTFTNNSMAVNGTGKVIKNSVFISNIIGITCPAFEARNCFFQYNSFAIDCWSGPSDQIVIDSCTIINNNIGIRVKVGSITNNNISNNVIGVISQHISSTENGIEYYVPIKNNRICNNTQYNIENDTSYNKNITQNCFCTTDSATIESKLFDGYDDITKGLFNYDIYDSTCQNVTQSIYKVGTNPLSSNTVISKEPNISISPNPFNDFISIQFGNQQNQLYSLRIYNTLGQKIEQFENINSEQKTIDCGNFKSGIYLLQIIQNGIIIEQQKLIKQ
ncbi:MAG: T9SS type A sorting domain-containing protein [Bacteroidia bacterium]|nr:T9SS type A sorting domain-containing protein [Bacteroidia bacterium]